MTDVCGASRETQGIRHRCIRAAGHPVDHAQQQGHICACEKGWPPLHRWYDDEPPPVVEARLPPPDVPPVTGAVAITKSIPEGG